MDLERHPVVSAQDCLWKDHDSIVPRQSVEVKKSLVMVWRGQETRK